MLFINYEQRKSTYLIAMTLYDWASWLIKNPKFSLSDDWLTFLVGVHSMGGGDSAQTF